MNVITPQKLFLFVLFQVKLGLFVNWWRCSRYHRISSISDLAWAVLPFRCLFFAFFMRRGACLSRLGKSRLHKDVHTYKCEERHIRPARSQASLGDPCLPRISNHALRVPPWQIVYARLLRLLYKLQVQVWRIVRKHDPQPYEQSVLGFLEPRLRMLSRVSSIIILHTYNTFVPSRNCWCRGFKQVRVEIHRQWAKMLN